MPQPYINPQIAIGVTSAVYSRTRKELSPPDFAAYRIIYEVLMNFMTTEGAGKLLEIILKTYQEALDETQTSTPTKGN